MPIRVFGGNHSLGGPREFITEVRRTERPDINVEVTPLHDGSSERLQARKPPPLGASPETARPPRWGPVMIL